MFRLSNNEVYFWPVKIEVPVDGGRFEKQVFDAQFKRISQSRLKEVSTMIQEEKMSDVELCREILVGWKGVVGDNNLPVDFSPTNLDLLLENHMAVQAVAKSFFESISGTKAKN